MRARVYIRTRVCEHAHAWTDKLLMSGTVPVNHQCFNSLHAIIRHTCDATTRYFLQKNWQTNSISVAFGSFFTYQVKEATKSLLLLLGDYLLQPSKAKRAADWNHAGEISTRYVRYGTAVSVVFALWHQRKTVLLNV